MLKRLFGKKSFTDEGLELYRLVVLQGRQPVFYVSLSVPDSVDGRFDLIALHVFLVIRRLKREGERSEALSQDLTEIFFADMDLNLRELGASDIGVGRRVKRMIEGYYGRALAYEAALEGRGEPLTEVLKRNLYGTVEPEAATLEAMAAYVQAADHDLSRQAWQDLSQGRVTFVQPQSEVESHDHARHV